MKNSNKPAYPTSLSADIESTSEQGLTKREYFAAMAMQGLLANSAEQSFLNQTPSSHLSIDQVAQRSVNIADELLKQLES